MDNKFLERDERLYEIKALDGKTYKTSLSGWHEQTIHAVGPLEGSCVWTKLLNIGEGGRLIAISDATAISFGINQLADAADTAKAEKIEPAQRKLGVQHYDTPERRANMEHSDARHKQEWEGSMNSRPASALPSRPSAFSRGASDKPPATRPAMRTSSLPAKKVPSSTHDTGSLISEEAQKLAEENE